MLNEKNNTHNHPTKTLRDLDWEFLTQLIGARCKTERGVDRARMWRPCDTAEEARAVRDELAEARFLSGTEGALSISIDLEIYESLDRLSKKGILDPEALLGVADVIRFGADLRRRLISLKQDVPLLAKRAARIKYLDDVSGPIRDSFLPSGELRDEASSELGALRKRAKSLRDEIVDRLKSMIEEPRIEKLLQDKYYTLREGRYVLPVKIESGHLLPGIVHARSNTEATVFLEPAEITELGNKLKMAFSDVEMEERRILGELSLLLREEIPAIKGNLEVLIQFDSISAAARLCADLDGRPVEIGYESGRGVGERMWLGARLGTARSAGAEVIEGNVTDGARKSTDADEGDGERDLKDTKMELSGAIGRNALNLKKARHPLMAARGERVVANDFVLDQGRSLVITGPNAGGKTVALKTVGLVCLMAQAGLHPPCEDGSHVPFYQSIFTSIGDDQDISMGLSTFTAHMTNLNNILQKANEGDLVLLDEIAVGTEPTQGAALARAVLESMADAGVQILVTTHYTGLKAVAAEDKRFSNSAMEFDSDNQKPTYKLVSGMLGRSSALSVARSLGLPDKLLKRAEELMGGQQNRLEGLMEEVERRNESLQEELARAKVAAEEAENRRRKVEELETKLRKELRDLKKHTHDQAVLELRSLRAEMDRVRKVLSRGPKSKRTLTNAEQSATQAAQKIAELAPEPHTGPGRVPEKGELEVGNEVIVSSTGVKGRVVDLDSKGRPTVQVGGVKLRLKLKDVLIPKGGKGGKVGKGGKGVNAAGGGAFHSGSQTKAGAKAKAKVGVKPGTRRSAGKKKRGMADRESEDPVLLVRDSSNTLDLRGMRADEAVDELDHFIDRMLSQDQEGFLVIHGFGTGALQRAVREHLGLHFAVDRYRPGRQGEGGEGVTVAFLES